MVKVHQVPPNCQVNMSKQTRPSGPIPTTAYAGPSLSVAKAAVLAIDALVPSFGQQDNDLENRVQRLKFVCLEKSGTLRRELLGSPFLDCSLEYDFFSTADKREKDTVFCAFLCYCLASTKCQEVLDTFWKLTTPPIVQGPAIVEAVLSFLNLCFENEVFSVVSLKLLCGTEKQLKSIVGFFQHFNQIAKHAVSLGRAQDKFVRKCCELNLFLRDFLNLAFSIGKEIAKEESGMHFFV